MKIGDIQLKNRVIMGPLAGITHLPFRLLAKRAGCALVCSEMVSANGLCYGSKKTRKLLKSDPEEKPVSFQIFGSDPEIMAEAAAMVEEAGADILDINMGCSVRKIIKAGSGVFLMSEPEKAGRIFRRVKKSVKIPVTVKTRAGWDRSGRDLFLLARIAVESGIDAISVHPRTASQGFSGKADWTLIKKVKEKVSIPVIGNGDITCPGDAERMIIETGCDAVMIGRAAIGNPFILKEIIHHLEGLPQEPLSIEKRLETMGEFASLVFEHFDEYTASRMLRSQLGWFSKGLPGSSAFRESIRHLAGKKDVHDRIREYALRLGMQGTPDPHI